MNDIMIDMTDYIEPGFRNGVTRLELRLLSGLSDRALRKAIEWTSETIEPIYSYDGKYFRIRDKRDLVYAEDYIRREKYKAKTLAKRARKSEKFLEEFM